MHNKQSNTQKPQERVRNVKAFIQGYVKQEHNAKVLNRAPFRDKNKQVQWRNPALALALVKAANG